MKCANFERLKNQNPDYTNKQIDIKIERMVEMPGGEMWLTSKITKKQKSLLKNVKASLNDQYELLGKA